jgi:hypothetical protein
MTAGMGAPMRSRLVLWGARDRDVQAGSPVDRAMSFAHQYLSERRRDPLPTNTFNAVKIADGHLDLTEGQEAILRRFGYAPEHLARLSHRPHFRPVKVGER